MTSPTPEVEVRRSARRRRTVSAYREGDRIVVLVPARLSKKDEQRLVADMVRKVQAAADKGRSTDAELMERATQLSIRYLGGLAHPVSVRWVGNQHARWGSCTPANGTIRLSDRLQGMPEYVSDYVLLHELAHLLQPDHGKSFWSLLEAYPRLERARGYLDGVAFGSGIPASAADDEPDEPGSLPTSALDG
ncbi:metal-dependent hydrolase [Flexivirga endophytica]|uniref:Metal-dependent hydrolase n=1 Tax=Flexivirga endophytica TaxID=1849103 RepID=A0A916TH92_9MICO|nr:M48 family metallopeptidase [Flexivirga endophytica]GGB44831.1 metal-dependent hydrolase [Flexivirga endophytica]GHB68729.1 metal-dependent hydrolase [Flexivirga endophytica]